MFHFTDQTGFSISLSAPPKRIISIVPSQTELLIDLGLANSVVGRTRFCIHPAEIVKDIAVVGGTKKLDFDRIATLKPDLIIGNKEENERQQIEELRKLYPVWLSDIITLHDALQMIGEVGALTQTETQANLLASEIVSAFSALDILTEKKTRRSLYLIWQNPWMAAGPQTFINEMMHLCGLHNAIDEHAFSRYTFTETEGSKRYPAFDDETLKMINPEVILLSSEPYPFARRFPEHLQQLLPNSSIHVVDGEMFSWYGSRLLKSPQYFLDLNQQLSLHANA